LLFALLIVPIFCYPIICRQGRFPTHARGLELADGTRLHVVPDGCLTGWPLGARCVVTPDGFMTPAVADSPEPAD